MIPHTIQLKNFLSYGSTVQKIAFDPYNLICLSGKNGHGKSALLDAITWAVWGQARKTVASVKPDQGLLRLGQTHMMVIFDFSCNGVQYRIRREYIHQANKMQAVLEFGLIDPVNQKLIALTDKTVRLTQHKIETTLHLDFESFVNSAFLRQGNANEFSKKSAKDRKEVLAHILGLTQYEQIKRAALNKIKQAQVTHQTLDAFCQKTMHDIEQSTLKIATFGTLAQEEERYDSYKNELHQRHKELEQKKSLLINQQQEQTLLQFKHDEIVKQQHEQELLLKNTLHTWRTINRQKKLLPALDQLEQQKKDLAHALHLQQQALQESLIIKEQLFTINQQIYTYQQDHKQEYVKKQNAQQLARERLRYQEQQLITQHAALLQHARQLKSSQQALVQEITDLNEAINKHHTTEAIIATRQQRLERRKNSYQQLNAQGNWINQALQQLIQKQQLSQSPDNPSCSLCEQNLTAARRKFLHQKFEREQKHLEHQKKRITRLLPALKKLLIDEHIALQELAKHHEHNQLRMHTIQEKRSQCHKIDAELALLTQQIEELDALHRIIVGDTAQLSPDIPYDHSTLNTLSAYQELIHKAHYLTQLLETHSAQIHTHHDIIAQLHKVDAQLATYHTMQTDIARQHERASAISGMCTGLRKMRILKITIDTQCNTFISLHEQMKMLEHAMQEHQLQQDTLNTMHHALLTQRIQLESEQKKIHAFKQELVKIDSELRAVNAYIQDYQIIAQATGKDGIQALLIEDTIPEIEREANYLLSKLTNNQAQIFIESLRDLKSGGTKETLDIKIADASGIRPYELFSGGEGFRIDLALRIAVSKLLAHRAGTTLQTLIIDEGFGSQDEEGLNNIMDAMYKIQDDFQKIIIVSHLPALKDQLPVHFIVEKGPQGSQVRIVEHD